MASDQVLCALHITEHYNMSSEAREGGGAERVVMWTEGRLSPVSLTLAVTSQCQDGWWRRGDNPENDDGCSEN